MISSPIKNNDIFYSENWRRREFKLMSILIPFFDVMIDRKYLYVIEMPKWKRSVIKECLILILLFFFLGLGLIGYVIITDRQKRKYYSRYRLFWLSANNELISQDYEKHIFLKVPLDKLKDNIVFGKNRFTLAFDKKKITLVRARSSLKLQKSKIDEFSHLKQLIKN